MPFKGFDLSREELEILIARHALQPELAFREAYIGNGPDYELLANLKPNGLYDIQLLDKKEVEKSIENTIRVFRNYTGSENI